MSWLVLSLMYVCFFLFLFFQAFTYGTDCFTSHIRSLKLHSIVEVVLLG